MKGQELARLAGELGGGWQVVAERQLEKEYQFKDFREALDFTNRVGELAEAQGHHPDIYLAWGKVKLTIWTHKINGLTESDFVLAAKADRLLSQSAQRIPCEGVVLHDFASHQMLLDNALKHLGCARVIPNPFRIHDRDRPLCADAQAIDFAPIDQRLGSAEVQFLQPPFQILP